jgi:hypothetical protein
MNARDLSEYTCCESGGCSLGFEPLTADEAAKLSAWKRKVDRDVDLYRALDAIEAWAAEFKRKGGEILWADVAGEGKTDLTLVELLVEHGRAARVNSSCPRCHGKGVRSINCDECNGTGVVTTGYKLREMDDARTGK